MKEHPAMGLSGELKTTLGPNSDHRYILVATTEKPKPEHITIDWMNESGDPGHYETDL